MDEPVSRRLLAEQEIARIQERNWFYESLSLEARERFLDTLVAAQDRGLDVERAWQEAVIAAEMTYAPEPDPLPPGERLDDDLPPAGP